jgi:hypothetical protein
VKGWTIVKQTGFRYGQPAGEFAGDTLNTVGNVYHISQNAKVVQPKHFAKRTAKEAGKALVYKHRSNHNNGASTSSHTNPSVSSLNNGCIKKFDKK